MDVKVGWMVKHQDKEIDKRKIQRFTLQEEHKISVIRQYVEDMAKEFTGDRRPPFSLAE